MRIGIDATALGASKTGTAIYLEEIIATWNRDKSLTHEFFLFVTEHGCKHFSGLDLDRRFVFVPAPANRYFRVAWQQVALPWHLYRLRPAVHWGPGFVLPQLWSGPMVVTVHDLTFQLFPEMHEGVKRFYFPAMIRASVRRARKILVVSESTRCDLEGLMPESRGKVSVTPLAARRLLPSRRHQGKYGKPYVLFVGTLEPRKNLRRLVEAWNSLACDERGETRLVVVGSVGWLVGDLLESIRENKSIEFMGHVNDAELADLMAGALALAYPSVYEGFGLPVIEAMAQGIPVLTSDVGATREVASGAAVMVDPESVDSIRGGLRSLIQDQGLRQRLSTQGRARAADFSWEATASQTLEALIRVGAQETK